MSLTAAPPERAAAPSPLVERRQARELRRMKAVAGGLLLLVTAVYAVTTPWAGTTWVGFVNRAAEAGMVGALADWFAVTALFRRPLGLPIPHTAIIPTRKAALGQSLQRFVGVNFLGEEVVRDKVRRTAPAARAGAWLCRPQNAQRVSAEAASLVRGAVTVLRDEEMQHVLDQTFVRRLTEAPWGPPAGRLLGRVVVDGSHHRLVDLAVAEVHAWLLANRDVLVVTVLQQAPTWTPRWVDERVADRVYAEALRFVEEVRDQPAHRVRLALDHLLLQVARDLRDDAATIERAEQVKRRLLGHPGVRDATGSLWTTTKRYLLDAVGDPRSELRTRLTASLASFGDRVCADEPLRGKLDRWVEDAAAHVVGTYRDEITTIISETIDRWDPRETTRKIELAVGRDLQYIRLNGTVIGALAGLAIHAATVLA